MNRPIRFEVNTASVVQIASHLLNCDAQFSPPLSARVDIDAYAAKVSVAAVRFEAWAGDSLIGLVAMYCNDVESRRAFVTSVSVSREWRLKRVAASLMDRCIAHAWQVGMLQIELVVARDNTAAISLYRKAGFVSDLEEGAMATMRLSLNTGDKG